MRPVIVLALLTLSCTAPEGRFACSDASECPSGWSCRADGLCWSSPGDDRGDAAVTIDGGTSDGGTSDGGAADGGAIDGGAVDAAIDASPTGDAGVDGGGAIECTGSYVAVTSPFGTGAERCSLFGGMFVRSESSGAPCRITNPFTGTCACPSGFMTRDTTSWRTVDGTGGVDTTARLYVCEPTVPQLDDSWGGLYIDNVTTTTCAYANRLAEPVPRCGCVAGYRTDAQWLGLNSAGESMRLVACVGPAPTDTATVRAAFSEGLESACTTCFATGGCDCPSDSMPFVFPGFTTGDCRVDSTLCVPTF